MNDIAENSLDAVLQVLALAVFADRRLKDEELTNIRSVVPTLSLFTDGELLLPDQGVDALIDKHLEYTRDLMDDSDLVVMTETILRRITNPLLAPLVLNTMREIANIDDDFHSAEDDLLSKAAAIWLD